MKLSIEYSANILEMADDHYENPQIYQPPFPLLRYNKISPRELV